MRKKKQSREIEKSKLNDILLSQLFFCFSLLIYVGVIGMFFVMKSFSLQLIVVFIIVFIANGLSIYLSIKSIFEKEHLGFWSNLYRTIVLHIQVWFIIMFVTSMFSNLIVEIIIVGAFIVIFYWLNNDKRKNIALVFSLITIIVFIIGFQNGFRENYCWGMADKSPSKNELYSNMYDYERKFMGSGSTNISGWYRVHLKCDREFKFLPAFQDKYFYNGPKIIILPKSQ